MRRSLPCAAVLCAALLLTLFSGGRAAASAGGEPAAADTPAAILLSDGGSVCGDPSVSIDGDTVTVTAAGDYLLSGSLSDGRIVIDAPKDAKVRLLLDGVRIVSAGRPAVHARSADRLVLSTVEGSESFIQSTGAFGQSDGSGADAAVYADCDLTLSGGGVLYVSSLQGHAVVSKDDLKLKSGTVSLEAAGKGLSGKDGIRVEGGTLNADVGTDALHSDGSGADRGTITVSGGELNLLCQRDGLDAVGSILIEDGSIRVSAGSAREGCGFKSDADITIRGGELRLTAEEDAIHADGCVTVTGASLTLSAGDDGIHADREVRIGGGTLTVTRSYEGIEARIVDISGGEIAVTARDDGINAAGGNDGSYSGGLFPGDPFAADGDAAVNISGGTVFINAEGDGLDSNGTLNVSGGAVYISGPTMGFNGAIDYGTDARITGGTVIAVGAAEMAENFGPDSAQGSILLFLSARQETGTEVSAADADGNVLAAFLPEKDYASVLVSTPELVLGGSYTVTAGAESRTVTLTELIFGRGRGMSGGFGGHMGQGHFGGPGGPEGDGPFGGPGGEARFGGFADRGGFGAPEGEAPLGGPVAPGGFGGPADGTGPDGRKREAPDGA